MQEFGMGTNKDQISRDCLCNLRFVDKAVVLSNVKDEVRQIIKELHRERMRVKFNDHATGKQIRVKR